MFRIDILFYSAYVKRYSVLLCAILGFNKKFVFYSLKNLLV